MKKILCMSLAILLPATVLPARTVVIPFGTTIFCELDQAVTTRQKEAHAVQSGDIVRAQVWKDVWVDGHVVIPAGTPVFAKVDRMKKARLAGQKGDLVIEAMSVQPVGGREIPVDGGYGRSGKGRMGVTIGLAVAIAWPFVFIKGKNVFLDEGTIFDAMVRASTEVEIPEGQAAVVPASVPMFQVTVPYGELDLDKKIKQLPLMIRMSEQELSRIEIVTVNGQEVFPIQVSLVGSASEDTYKGSVDFKVLSKHFKSGMNRFEVQMGAEIAEVLLEIEL
jgi:hypothetical protein